MTFVIIDSRNFPPVNKDSATIQDDSSTDAIIVIIYTTLATFIYNKSMELWKDKGAAIPFYLPWISCPSPRGLAPCRGLIVRFNNFLAGNKLVNRSS